MSEIHQLARRIELARMTNSRPGKSSAVFAGIFLFFDKFSKFIKAAAPAFLVPVAAFDGRKFLVRQKQLGLLPACAKFQRDEHLARLDLAEFFAAAVFLKRPGEDQTLRRLHFAINSNAGVKLAIGIPHLDAIPAAARRMRAAG